MWRKKNKTASKIQAAEVKMLTSDLKMCVKLNAIKSKRTRKINIHVLDYLDNTQ